MVKLSFGLTKSTFGVVKECQIDLLRHTVHGHVGCSLAVDQLSRDSLAQTGVAQTGVAIVVCSVFLFRLQQAIA